MKTKQPWTKTTVSDVTESAHGNSALTVDRERGVIKGVRVLNLQSRNGYEYTKEAVKDALPKYQNLVVNIDHTAKPGMDRSSRDRFGRLVNAQLVQDGITADLEYLKSHPMAETIAEAAERMPEVFGLSHVAKVKWRTPAKTVAESLLAIRSADIVANPATTSSLQESQGSHTVQTFSTVRESIKPGTKARKFIDWLCEEDMGMGDMPMEAPAADMDPDDQALEALVTMIRAALKDKDFDKAKKVLDTFKKLMGEEPAPMEEPVDDPAAEEPAAEGRKPGAKPTDPAISDLQEQLQTLRRKDQARELCDEEGIKPSAVLLKHLLRCENEAEMKELIQESKAADKPAPARVKSALQTTVSESQGKPPTSADEAKRRWGGKAPVASKN